MTEEKDRDCRAPSSRRCYICGDPTRGGANAPAVCQTCSDALYTRRVKSLVGSYLPNAVKYSGPRHGLLRSRSEVIVTFF